MKNSRLTKEYFEREYFDFDAIVRSAWLYLFKKISIFFFTSDDIEDLTSQCGLKDTDWRDVGMLWVVKFVKTAG